MSRCSISARACESLPHQCRNNMSKVCGWEEGRVCEASRRCEWLSLFLSKSWCEAKESSSLWEGGDCAQGSPIYMCFLLFWFYFCFSLLSIFTFPICGLILDFLIGLCRYPPRLKCSFLDKSAWSSSADEIDIALHYGKYRYLLASWLSNTSIGM